MGNEYLLIVKKIRDMIVYNNIMLRQFPKEEKFLLANKIRELFKLQMLGLLEWLIKSVMLLLIMAQAINVCRHTQASQLGHRQQH